MQLIEVGVRCVEVTLDGWDTHVNNESSSSRGRCEILDPAFAALIEAAQGAEPARLDDRPLGRRIRPHAHRSTRLAAATTGRTASPSPWPAAAFAAAA